MNKINIEWVQNPDGTQGYTCNSKTGCFNGCEYCYARKLANGRLKQRYLANPIWIGHYAGGTNTNIESFHAGKSDPFYPRWWPERLEQIRKRKTPSGIFLDDMSDWMGDYWPDEWTQQELQVMRDCPQHRFYTLTKQPQNLVKWSPFPDNCWVGVTATDYAKFLEACNYLEYPLEAKVRYLSLEPLLGWENNWTQSYTVNSLKRAHINWLIIGACTGSLNSLKYTAMTYPELTLVPYGKMWTLQPKIEWVQEIVHAADKAGVKVFLKNNLMPLFEAEGITRREDWTGIRQEIPK